MDSQWDLDNIFAGTAGKGAEDAWWMVAAMIEQATMLGKKLSGYIVDIRKCFDQISRALASYLLNAGMPPQVVSAYLRYHSKLSVYNGIAVGLGRAYYKDCSIPQGCPLSMMIIALMLRPWLKVVEQMGAEGRILADDIIVTATGKNHAKVFERAYDATHEYMHDIGAKIASKRSLTFAARPHDRRTLKHQVWPAVGGTIRLVLHTRDLGAHVTTTAKITSTTLNNRIKETATLIKRMAWLPLD